MKTTAGFVVVADGTAPIYALGTTEAEARADYERQARESWGSGSERTVPATARLIDYVSRHGGSPIGLRWHLDGGVADLSD